MDRVRVTLWGTRGSLAAPGPDTVRYGGNTSCVEVRGADGSLLVLDAGTGVRRLGAALGTGVERVHLLLTHLHMDHIQGLGFFTPLFQRGLEVHIWGPPSPALDLGARLARYLSPPLFPVRLGDLPCRLWLHEVPLESFEIGNFLVQAAFVSHPGPTVGYRITEGGASVAYLPDHEVAIRAHRVSEEPDRISGFALAAGADLLIHDAQYSADEYPSHAGWGHSAIAHAVGFASLAGAKRLVTFHHDPGHADSTLDRLVGEVSRSCDGRPQIIPGTEGATFELGARTPRELVSAA